MALYEVIEVDLTGARYPLNPSMQPKATVKDRAGAQLLTFKRLSLRA